MERHDSQNMTSEAELQLDRDTFIAVTCGQLLANMIT